MALQKIYPYQTEAITRNDKNRPEFSGFSADTCCLFKAVTGMITCYSPLADDGFTNNFIRYIQKNNGSILKLNPDNLEGILKDNEKTLNLFKKKKYNKAIAAYNDSE